MINIINNDLCCAPEEQITGFDFIDLIKHVIGDDYLCVQLDRNLWRVYLKSTESRVMLFTQGININDVYH